jgi:hypothetical protein
VSFSGEERKSTSHDRLDGRPPCLSLLRARMCVASSILVLAGMNLIDINSTMLD